MNPRQRDSWRGRAASHATVATARALRRHDHARASTADHGVGRQPTSTARLQRNDDGRASRTASESAALLRARGHRHRDRGPGHPLRAGPRGPGPRRRRPRGGGRLRRPPRPAAPRAQGQAHHLPVPVRRSLAARAVGLQAGPRADGRRGPAALGARRPARHHHDGGAGALPPRPVHVRVPAARRHGHVGQRPHAPHREDRRRADVHQVDAHRGDQPRPRHHLLPDRGPARRAGPAWGRGSRTASAA